MPYCVYFYCLNKPVRENILLSQMNYVYYLFFMVFHTIDKIRLTNFDRSCFKQCNVHIFVTNPTVWQVAKINCLRKVRKTSKTSIL